MSQKVLFTVLENQLKERMTLLEQNAIDEMEEISILKEQMNDIKSTVNPIILFI